jgi:ABC-2 type transport system permease protein
MFVRQLINELHKLFARKRTYIGFGAFFAVQIIILALLQLPKAKAAIDNLLTRNGYGSDEYVGGLSLGLIILKFTFVLLGALYLALVGGDIVAKEIEDGTMRLILCRPVSRVRLMIVKWLACMIYTITLVFFMGFSALMTGLVYRGKLGKLFVFAPEVKLFSVFDMQEGLYRYVRAVGIMALCTMAISSVAFMFSCFRVKPAAATVLTLSCMFVDLVLYEIPYFSSYRSFFVTGHISCWVRTFDDLVPWWTVAHSLTYLAALCATCWIIGSLRFCTLDLKG